MKLGLLLFPHPVAPPSWREMAEGMGFDRQNITPELWSQLMLAARRHGEFDVHQ